MHGRSFGSGDTLISDFITPTRLPECTPVPETRYKERNEVNENTSKTLPAISRCSVLQTRCRTYHPMKS